MATRGLRLSPLSAAGTVRGQTGLFARRTAGKWPPPYLLDLIDIHLVLMGRFPFSSRDDCCTL